MIQSINASRRSTPRSGCLPTLLVGILGASTAVIINWINVPVIDPKDPLAHEWSSLGALMLVLVGFVFGAMVGWITSEAWVDVGPNGGVSCLAGLVLGFAIGELMMASLVLHLILSDGFAFLGILLAAWSTERRSQVSTESKV